MLGCNACVLLNTFFVCSSLPFYLPSLLPSLFLLVINNLVRQLHREFQRAGADVIQAFTFSMDDDLEGDQAKYGVRTTISKCLSVS